jgi:serine/threonine protein kinase
VRPSREYGPYHLVEKVAVGGMAEVWKATQSGIGGFVKVLAVKRLLPHLARNADLVDLFINEAKMVARLTHPNIVQIYDLGRIEKSYYIAMEYVPGRDLRTVRRRAAERGLRIPLDLAVLVTTRVCAALAYAHKKRDEQGRAMSIVHRDVSPQNILLSYEGEVKLTDFGIAKAASKARTTDNDMLRGKLLYMSPEQARGEAADHRTDLFALGIVLFELVTGVNPFEDGGGGSQEGVLERVRNCRVPLASEVNPRVPAKLDQVIAKALHPLADERYPDAVAFGRALDRAVEPSNLGHTQLSRLMDVLFDAQERGRAADGSSDRGTDPGAFEIEFDYAPTPVSPLATLPPARPPARSHAVSIDELVERFNRRKG